MGEQCRECGREGPCSTCHGLITVLDAALADLFSRLPLTEVELTGVRPIPVLAWPPGEGDAAAEWPDAARWVGSEDDSVLPHSLFEMLADYINCDGRKACPPEAAAQAAVGPAVVALGRRLAGLPTLQG